MPKESVIFVQYHSTSIDAPLITQYLASQGNYSHGLMHSGAFSRLPIFNSLVGEIPFDHAIRKKSSFKWSMDEVEYWLDQGHSILTSNDGSTDRHKGKKLEEKLVSTLPERISKKTGKKIVPVSPYVYNAENLYLWQGKTSWKELTKRWRLDYFLGFSEPMNPEDYENPREMHKETKRRQILMYSELEEKERIHREGTSSWLKQAISFIKKTK